MRINYKKTAQLFLSSFFSTLLFVLGVYFFSLPTLAAPGINRTINFQGKVVNKSDSTNVTNGSYTFVFKLYDASSGGNQLPTGTPWSESQSLTVTNGVFRASLGEVTPIPTTIDFNSDALWLDVTFNGETFGSRIRLTAVPYAFNAEKVAGLTVTNTTGTLTIPNAKTISFADAFTTSGAFPLTLTTTASTNITLPTTGTLATLAGAEIFTNKTIGSTGLVFSGATTDISTVANEDLIISPNGTGKVGIGAGSPGEKLEVNGNILASSTARTYITALSSNSLGPELRVQSTDSGGKEYRIGSSATGNSIAAGGFFIFDATTTAMRMVINTDGKVGFGSTAPTEKIDILGNATASGNITLGGQLQVGRFGYDPIAFGNGSISYNTTTNKFRCYQNGSWTDCIGAGGTPTWDSITNPGGNLGLTMNSYTSTFTYGSSTSTNNLFNLADTASNTGTGYLFNLTTGSGSTLNPLRVRNGLADTLIIDSNGRIGVNTAANLTEAINVNGNFSFAPNDGSGRSLGVLFNTSGGGDGTNLDIFAGGGDLGFGGDLSLYAGTGGGGPGGSVYIYGGSGTSQGNVILAHLAGKVAVGHTIPTEMLDVLGNATVSGYLTVGQAGGIRSQYGGLNFQYKSNQNAWTTGMVLKDTTGFLGLGNLNPTANLDISSSQTTGNAVNITANSLTSGNGMYLSSTATALTGDLLSLYINPASASIITGDVLGINSGSNLTLSGYYLNIQNNGSAVFQVGQNQIVSAVPHSFTAAGDVSMAYDLIFTNSTASYIKSDSPFYVESGPVWGSNDLTLRTFNYGKVIADSDTLYAVKDLGVGGSATISGQLRLGNYAVAPTAAGAGSLYYDSGANKVYYYNGSAWTEMGAGTSSGPSVFQEAAGIIRPMNNTADVLFGGTATASAKFAFLNLNSGTPMLRIDNDSDNTNKGCFRYNGTSNQMEYSNDCSTFQGFSSSTGGGWTDDGTTVRLTTSTDNLGVGTATAPEKLTVSGNATASGNITMGGQLQMGRFAYDPIALGNGSTYYNTASNKFRCYVNGAWTDCGGGSASTSKFIVKGSNQNIASGTTLTDDSDLTFAVETGETWVFQYFLRVTNINNATPDWKAAVKGATGWTCSVTQSGEEPAGAAFPQATTTDCDGSPTAMVNNTIAADVNVPFQVRIQGSLTTNSSGNITLQWAPNTSGSLTVMSGSYVHAQKVGGSDLAEMYYTLDDTLASAEVVVIDSRLSAGVQKSTKAYDPGVVGVITTKPGLMIGEQNPNAEGRDVLVALSGRVPVKVSSENGIIQAGDYLTSSSMPGHAMKATKGGVVIGQALEDYEPNGNGTVLMFIKNGFYNGSTSSEYTSDKTASYSLLTHLLNEKENPIDRASIQELVSDRIVGGLELVAPEVITNTVSTKSITSTENIDIRISPEGELRIGSTTATDTAAIRFDAEGNAYFAGALSANRILASSIAGLDELSARIASLEARIHNSSQSALLNYDALIPSSTLSAVLEGLTLTQDATIGGKLQVKGSALIEGVLSVIDTVTSSNVVVSSWFSSMGKAIFHDSVQFMGRPTFNADTGGYVVIKKGTQSVDVEFTNEYESMPVINVTRVTESENLQSAFNTSVRYVIGKRTTKGFTIQLDQNASEDMTFSWTALSISAKAQ